MLGDDDDRPSTETADTPQPPKGEDLKKLMTPGADAEKEVDADPRPAAGAGEQRTEPARPVDPEEAQSPT